MGRSSAEAAAELESVSASVRNGSKKPASFLILLSPTLRKALLLGLLVAVLQQATGINAIFFYAPMIFELSGVGTDASFMQAVLVGLTNLVFTIVAISLIDRAGRRPLLLAGLAGIAVCMTLLSYGFSSARFVLDETMLTALGDQGVMLQPLLGQVFHSDLAFRDAVVALIGQQEWQSLSGSLMSTAIQVNSVLILLGILGFVASFAISLGPVMWVLLSELFPNHARALAISFVGLVNSGVSFAVQFIFPWELDEWGASLTFGIYAAIALLGWLLVLRLLPETKGRSLESLERVFTAEKTG
jgi:MFS family permease